jgi:peptidoglycan/xylan/chitin deacetylase (PgdA/CDA1 family)
VYRISVQSGYLFLREEPEPKSKGFINRADKERMSKLAPKLADWLRAVVQRKIGSITHVNTRKPLVALTFDDGPHAEFTPRILETLGEHGAKATFFMVGEAAHSQPDLVRRVTSLGHVIANHSWDHPAFPDISCQQRRLQLRACSRSLRPFEQRLFRPPFGKQNVSSRLDALCLGYEVVTWSLAINDWRERDPEVLLASLTGGVRPGCIVLMHDTIFSAPAPHINHDREALLNALSLFLSRVEGTFRFVTLPELFRSGKIERSNWFTAPVLRRSLGMGRLIWR